MPVTRSGVIADEVIGASLKTVDYQQLTDLSSVVAISLSDSDVIEAQVQAEGADIRYRTDGENPTSSVGMKLVDGDTLFITGLDDIVAFRAIQVSSGAKLNITLRG